MYKKTLILFLFLSVLTSHLRSQDLSVEEKKKWELIGQKHYDRSDVAWYNGAFDTSLVYTKLAYEAYDKAQNWGKANDLLLEVAGIYYHIDDYEQTTIYNDKAIAHCKKYLSPQHVNNAFALEMSALVLEAKGRYKKAIANLQEARKLYDSNDTSPHDIAITLQNLAQVQRRQGDYDEAIVNLKQALYLQTGNAETTQFELARLNILLAYNYKLKRDFKRALAFNQRAAEKLKGLPLKGINLEIHIETYANQAEIYRLNNQLDSARIFIQKVVQLQGNDVVYLKPRCYLELGELAMIDKNYDEAVKYFTTALEWTEKKYKNDQSHPKFGLCWGKIADAHLANGAISQALEHYQDALKVLSIGFAEAAFEQNPDLEIMLSFREGFPILQGKAKALMQLYEKEQKITYLEAALTTYQHLGQLINKTRSGFMSEESKFLLLSNAQSVCEEGIESALKLYELTKQETYFDQAFYFAEANKAILMQESLAEDQALGVAGIPDSLLEQEASLSNDISFYERLVLEARRKKELKNEQQYKEREEKLFVLRQNYQELQRTLESTYPRYHQLKYKTELTQVKTIQAQHLNDKSVLLEYFVGAGQIYLFAIGKNFVETSVIKNKANLIQGIEALRPLINRPSSSNQFLAEADQFNQLTFQLYQSLFEPVLAQYPTINRLIIIPDAELNYLPFELLQTQANEQADYRLDSKDYVLEQYTIGYCYSAGLLAKKGIAKKHLTPFMGFAPVFRDRIAEVRSCNQDEMYSLQCNQQEVELIQELWGGTTYAGTKANKNNFRKEVEQARIVHLATHACVNLDDGALNQIFFTDDYLTSVELKKLNLAAELTVLSACNTGSGKMHAGEGLMSLARSITIAGCPSTLMSLWSVDDCATSDIMVDFYRELQTGKDKFSAVRGAKLNYLATAGKGNAHPYYWAPFLLVGDAMPLQTAPLGFISSIWFWGALALMLLGGMIYRRKY